MSSILDALKKSERQRSLGRELIFRNAAPDAAPRLTGFAMAVLAALVVLVIALAALLFNLREPELPESTISPTAVRGAEPVVTGPVADDAPAMATRPETTQTLDSQTHTRIKAAPPPEKAASAKVPSPAAPSSRTPEAELSAPTPATNTGDAPWLKSLPPAFRDSLPSLAVNIHVYSPDQSQRILYINNRQARQGERIEGGVVVEEIVHDGVVLQYRGQRFKLPRPS